MSNNISGYLCATVTKAESGRTKQLAKFKHNLLTNAGRDAFHALVYTNTAAGTRGFGYVGVTETAVTPAVGDTTLAGEIVVNGLQRADATTKTHSAGTNSTTVEHTYTAGGAFTDVKASATFVGSGAVTMGHIATFSTGSGTLASNDTLKVTWTLNLG